MNVDIALLGQFGLLLQILPRQLAVMFGNALAPDERKGRESTSVELFLGLVGAIVEFDQSVELIHERLLYSIPEALDFIPRRIARGTNRLSRSRRNSALACSGKRRDGCHRRHHANDIGCDVASKLSFCARLVDKV
jgi:hypothetical protein